MRLARTIFQTIAVVFYILLTFTVVSVLQEEVENGKARLTETLTIGTASR